MIITASSRPSSKTSSGISTAGSQCADSGRDAHNTQTKKHRRATILGPGFTDSLLTWPGDPTGQTYNVSVGAHDSFDGVDHVRLVHEVEKVDVAIPHILQVIVTFDVNALMWCSDKV